MNYILKENIDRCIDDFYCADCEWSECKDKCNVLKLKKSIKKLPIVELVTCAECNHATDLSHNWYMCKVQGVGHSGDWFCPMGTW